MTVVCFLANVFMTLLDRNHVRLNLLGSSTELFFSHHSTLFEVVLNFRKVDSKHKSSSSCVVMGLDLKASEVLLSTSVVVFFDQRSSLFLCMPVHTPPRQCTLIH